MVAVVDATCPCSVLVVRFCTKDGSTTEISSGVAKALEVVSVRLRDLSCFSTPQVSSPELCGVGAVGMDDDSVRIRSRALLGVGLCESRGAGDCIGSLFFFLPEILRTSRLMLLGLCGDGGASDTLFRSSSDNSPNGSCSGGPILCEEAVGSPDCIGTWGISTDEVLGP